LNSSIDRHAAFGHHLLEIAIAYAVAAVPAHRPEHDLTLKVAPLEVRHGPAPSLAPAFHRGAPKALQQSRHGPDAVKTSNRLGLDECPPHGGRDDENPSGLLRRSKASLAKNLLQETPADAVSSVSALILARISSAICVAEAMLCRR
jgi:hypothetical protein